MDTYRDRLERVAEGLLEAQRAESRRAWGSSAGDHPNIVNTAEAMILLARAGYSYESDYVQRAIDYLATRVFIHTRARDEPGGRGPLTRWPLYTLIGLTSWPDWADDQRPRRAERLDRETTVPEAVAYCVRWLRDRRVGHGWPDVSPDGGSQRGTCSVLQTAAVARTLVRLGELESEVEAALDLLAKRQNRKDGSFPPAATPTAYRGAGSPPHTAIAVLALASGHDEHQKSARRGADWLLTNTKQWQHAIHPEPHEGPAPWAHMTFALGLCACLAAGEDPLLPALRPAIGYLDFLWSEDLGSWALAEEGRPTVHCAHAVSGAYEALSAATHKIDPLVLFGLVEAGESNQNGVGDPLELVRSPCPLVVLRNSETGAELARVSLGEAAWSLVDHLITGRAPATEVSAVRLKDLERFSKAPRPMIRRINRSVRSETGNRVATLIAVPRKQDYCYLTIPPAGSEVDSSPGRARS